MKMMSRLSEIKIIDTDVMIFMFEALQRETRLGGNFGNPSPPNWTHLNNDWYRFYDFHLASLPQRRQHSPLWRSPPQKPVIATFQQIRKPFHSESASILARILAVDRLPRAINPLGKNFQCILLAPLGSYQRPSFLQDTLQKVEGHGRSEGVHCHHHYRHC